MIADGADEGSAGPVGNFLRGLVGGPDHPKPILQRRRVWYLLLCWAFAASPVVAWLAGAVDHSTTPEPVPMQEPAIANTRSTRPTGPVGSSARAGAADQSVWQPPTPLGLTPSPTEPTAKPTTGAEAPGPPTTSQ